MSRSRSPHRDSGTRGQDEATARRTLCRGDLIEVLATRNTTEFHKDKIGLEALVTQVHEDLGVQLEHLGAVWFNGSDVQEINHTDCDITILVIWAISGETCCTLTPKSRWTGVQLRNNLACMLNIDAEDMRLYLQSEVGMEELQGDARVGQCAEKHVSVAVLRLPPTPAAVAAPPHTQSRTLWSRVQSVSRPGHFYYFNQATGRSVWVPPRR